MLIASTSSDATGRVPVSVGLRARDAQSAEEDQTSRGPRVDGQDDILDISPEGLAAVSAPPENEEPTEAEVSGQEELSEEEQRAVEELERRDEEVRRHEQAHVAAGGRFVRGGASLEYTTGPDGRRYATGGEVSIDIGTARTPQATIQKMGAVKRAAVAPVQPSAQDRAVYRAAVSIESTARQELAAQNREQVAGGGGSATPLGASTPASATPANGTGAETRRTPPAAVTRPENPASDVDILPPPAPSEAPSASGRVLAPPTGETSAAGGGVLAPSVDETPPSGDGALTPPGSDVSPVVQGPPVRRLDVLV
jgi:SprA-related family